MADTRWNIRKVAWPLPARLKSGQDGLDNQTVSADGGDAGVAIVDTRPLKRIVQEI